MIVLDASAAIDLLLRLPKGASVEAVLRERPDPILAPDLMAVEVSRYLRRGVLREELTERRAEEARQDLNDLQIDWFPAVPLLPRAWQLHKNVTIDDAIYVALAQAAGATLLTTDSKLAKPARKLAGLRVVP